MLVVNPAETGITTAPTPTPIGCKLLKINPLPTSHSMRCRSERCAFYRTSSLRQLLFETFDTGFASQIPQIRYCLFDSRLALRFEEVRILQSKNAPSITFTKQFPNNRKQFSNNRDAGESSLADLRHHSRAHRDAHAFVCHALAVQPDAPAGDLADGIRGAGHQSRLLQQLRH